MPKKGTWYEDIVAEIAGLLYQGATVHVRQPVEGPDGKREVDVEIRTVTDGHEQFILLECKDWKTPVDVPAIDGLHSKSLDLKPDLTIIFSNSGFTKMALHKARRLGIGALSALKAGEERIRYVVERLFVAKALLVDQWQLKVFPSAASDESFPKQWETVNLFCQDQPVINWLSPLSRDLLAKHPDAKEIVWMAAFLNETEFSISGQRVILCGLQLTLFCSQKYVSQVVQEVVTVGAFDHVRRGVVIPSSQTYTLGAFDREGWEDYNGTPEEARELPPDTFSVDMLLFKPIPPIPGAGIPPIAEVLNPSEQKLVIK